MKDTLFDAGERRATHGATRELVGHPAGRCPACGDTGLTSEVVEEDALLRHGGHGATMRSVRRHCSCGWTLLAERTEVRPPRTET